VDGAGGVCCGFVLLFCCLVLVELLLVTSLVTRVHQHDVPSVFRWIM